MRSWLLVIITVLIATVAGRAQSNPQLLFDQANDLLEQGQYTEAMQKYYEIEETGSVSGPLFLNMGIAAAELDSMGLAKFYFLKASEFDITELHAQDALEYVSAQFSRQSATLPKLPWDKAVDRLKAGPGATGVFAIGFVLVLIAFSLILLHWFRVFTFSKHSGIILGLVIFSVSVVGLSFYVDYVDQRYAEGVIVNREIQVRQQAAEQADLVSLAYEGYSITVDERLSRTEDNWLYIRLGNGQYGWIPDEGVRTF